MHWTVPLIIVLLSLIAETSFGDEPTTLESQAKQVLAENCLKCHGQKKQSGKLDLRTLDSITKGGKRGPAITPGIADSSRLVQLVRPGAKPHMPPGKSQLSEAQIASLSNWINSLPSKITESTIREPASETSESTTWLPPVGADATSVINMFLQAGYRERGISPNPRADDATFVRRIYVDLIGRIPTPDETDDFLVETDSNKRTRLIDDLLQSAAHAKHLARIFDVMLMGRNEKKRGDRKQHGWNEYLARTFRENQPWNLTAREILLGRTDHSERGQLWFLYERKNNHQAIAEAVSKSFFGVDIACAQCHDHPVAEEILQSHYWGLVAFFNRSKNGKSKHGIAIAESAIGGFNDYANALAGTTDSAMLTYFLAGVVAEDRPAEPDKQKDSDDLYETVDGEPKIPKFSRRAKFVDEVLADHPLLAKSMVNRMWALFMGRGIIHPAENIDSQHPPSHPALLEWLARDFREDYNLRRLVRAIVRSRAYQLTSTVPAGVQPDSFAYGLEKPLTAESLTDSLAIALKTDSASLDGIARQLRKQFGEVLPLSEESNVRQALLLSNHPEIDRLVKAAAEKIQVDDSIVNNVRSLFHRVFGREPSDDELFRTGEFLRSREDRLKDAYAQLLWAMVTSAEFRFNH